MKNKCRIPAARSGSKKRKHSTHSKPYLRLSILLSILFLILLLIAYAFWPFHIILKIDNERASPLIANITITDSHGTTIFSDTRNYLDLKLSKGVYNVTVTSKGYQARSFIVDRGVGLGLNRDYIENITLAPKYIKFSDFTFHDITHRLELGPVLHVIGKTILGEYFQNDYLSNGTMMYGDYIVYADSNFFDASFEIRGDQAFQKNVPVKTIVLYPDDKLFYYVDKYSADQILNYLKDYMQYSQDNMLLLSDRGMPKQYYLYNQNTVLSLGDMITLFCEHKAYASENTTDETYFLPKDKLYFFGAEAETLVDCYAQSLIGAVPAKVSGMQFEDSVYSYFFGEDAVFDYGKPDLNIRIHGPEVGFSFDVESGRYVFEDNGVSVSPCTSTDYSLGLKESEIVCNDPAFVAWMSPYLGKIMYSDFSYPQVSGMLGYVQVLEYADEYGIPVTGYYVKKDVVAFSNLDPDSIEKTRKLVSKGLIEIGSHTRYHTNLGLVPEIVALTELKESKSWLENYFNATVVGFRGPYQSMVGNNELTHAKALQKAGYSYFTQFGDYLGLVPGTNVSHKQWNGGWNYFSFLTTSQAEELVHNNQYVITLDHPWNMVFSEAGNYIVQDQKLLKQDKANIFTVINNGGRPVLVRDIEL